MRRKRSGQFEYTFWGKGTAGRCDFGRIRKIERLSPFTEYVLSRLCSASGDF